MPGTNKIILIIITLNIMFGMYGVFKDDINNNTNTNYKMIDEIETEFTVFSDNDPNENQETGGANMQYELTAGSTSLWSTMIRGSMGAINPFSGIERNTNDGYAEQALQIGIAFIRSLLLVVLGIEIYAFLKNKKTQT